MANRTFLVLLGQANVNLKALNRVEMFSLFGYAWTNPVPWEAKK